MRYSASLLACLLASSSLISCLTEQAKKTDEEARVATQSSQPAMDAIKPHSKTAGNLHFEKLRYESLSEGRLNLQVQSWTEPASNDQQRPQPFLLGASGRTSSGGEPTVSTATAVRELQMAEKKAPGEEKQDGILTIRFEGSDVSSNAARILAILSRLKVVDLKSRKAQSGDSVAKIYRDALAIPGYSAQMNKLANQLNDTKYELRHLAENETVVYPDVRLGKYNYSVKYDPDVASDRMEIQELREAGDFRALRQESLSSGLVRVVKSGYQIKLEVASESAEHFLKWLKSEDLRDVIVDYSPSKVVPTKYHSRPRRNAKAFWSDSILPGAKLPVGQQGALGFLVGLKAVPDCLRDYEAHPELVLLDQPIWPHPDLEGAVQTGVLGEFSQVGKPLTHQQLKSTAFIREKHHGTHLACIIGCRDDGFGLIGINPQSHIFPLNWSRLRAKRPELLDEMENRDRRKHFQIYSFASEWGSDKKMSLSHEEDRFKDMMARKIKALRNLWIVAAGQGANASNITKESAKFPMNLGDLPNVVVVTACTDCEATSLSLRRPGFLSEANFSRDGLVHLAAPGVAIPSTANEIEYAVADGTSQAMAFTAGTATAMAHCFPNTYKRASLIKERLQVSSRPVFRFADRTAERVTSGILDAYTALLDPCKDWLRTGQAVDPRVVELDSWCSANLVLLNPESGDPVKNGYIRTRDIYRIVRFDAADSPEPKLWVVYTRVGYDDGHEHQGEIVRIGPGTLGPVRSDPRFRKNYDPLFKTKEGKVKSLNDVKDLVLRITRQERVSSCENQPHQ